MVSVDVAMVRAATLSVEEMCELLASDRLDDPWVLTAMSFAVDAQVTRALGSSERARTTLRRYIARMAGRATPYGLFAGFAYATVGDARWLALGERLDHALHVRVDIGALRAMVGAALDEAEFDRWPLRRNPKVRTDDENVHYSRPGDGTSDVVRVRRTAAIREVLRVLADRPRAAGAVLDALQERLEGATRPSLRAFLRELVTKELVVPAVDLVEPGVEPARVATRLLETLGDRRRATALRDLITATGGSWATSGALVEQLDGAWERAAVELPTLADVPRHQRYHVDLEMAMDRPEVDRGTVTDLTHALRRLDLVFPPNDHLQEFRQAFRERYEDAEVPLLEALDMETGLLRPPERAMSRLARRADVRGTAAHPSQRISPTLLRILDRWNAGDDSTVDIADLPMADRSSARGVYASLLDGYEDGYHTLLHAGYRRSPIALLARFGLDRENVVRRIRWLEGDQDAGHEEPLHAELVYAPDTRIANMLIRPRTYADAVALTGGQGGTLALDQLLIRLDGDTLRLRDADSGRDVLIELSSAHNINAPALDPVYSFLGQLASPGAVGWRWGALTPLSRLPRVTCGAVIVSPEIWRLTKAEAADVPKASDPVTRFRGLLQGSGGRRWFGVGSEDRMLPIDATSARSVMTALARFDDEQGLQVVEMPQLESPAIAGPSGRHVGEVVIPLPGTRPRAHSRGGDAVRFDPALGRGWVYVRHYCTAAAADAVVLRHHDLAAKLSGEGVITGWFFLRYTDEAGHHVRARMRPTRHADRPTVLAALDALAWELRESALVSRAVTDEYVPEVARYGGSAALRSAEELFAADSDAVARFLASGPDEETRLAQCVTDALGWATVLSDSYDARHEWFLRCGRGLGLSFEQHGKLFREMRGDLDRYTSVTEPDPEVIRRVDALLRALADGDSQVAPESVLGSAMHMHCNRVFHTDARKLEFVAYDFAARKIREYRARGGPEASRAQGTHRGE